MFKNTKYINPNKYLIKKNFFIRDFQSLYKSIKDPWNQNKNFENEESVIILKALISKLSNNKKKINLLDVGAGSGALKKILKKNISYVGTDIHKKKFKNVIYDDISIYKKKFKKNFEIIVCLKTVYYIGDKIKKVLSNFKKYLKKNGILIISYNLKKKSFSNKYLTDIKLRKMLKKKFIEIYTIEINRELYESNNKNEKTTLLIFKKK
jgi:2-polyprenyl-3-methyl-5-hydroxy-6-metoxy-1,4-benzoquinol methylase|tara:strand:- start:8282 stop:8905 length:624 start_codon:yes stop_codon:yes gene_type:complete